MKQINENLLVRNSPWFKIWFDSAYYHKLYAHRDEAEAADFIDELVAVLQPTTGAVMLDVGCGKGRTTILQGVVLLMIFAVYLFTTIVA